MDADHVDALARSLTITRARRRALAAALAGVLGTLGLGTLRPEGTEAKKKKCPPCKKRKQGKCKKTLPDGTACAGGSCQSGSCVATAAPPPSPSPPPPPSPVTRTDVVCPGPTNELLTVSGDARVAQTFTPSTSGQLVSARLILSRDAATFRPFFLVLSPVDASGEPTNVVLASTSEVVFQAPSGSGNADFTFPTPFSVNTSTQYALVVTRPGPDTFVVLGKNANICAGQAFFSPNQSDSFAPITSPSLPDITLTIFIRS